MSTKRKYVEDEMDLQHVTVKAEVVNDADSDDGEYYIFADDMEVVELSGGFPYLRAALSLENPNNENNSNIFLVDSSSISPPFAADSSNDQSVESDNKSPLYIDLCSSKTPYKSKVHKERVDFGEHFILKSVDSGNIGTVGNQSSDYDSEIVIYPVENSMQNFEGETICLQNRDSVTVKNERGSNPIQIGDCSELLQINDPNKMIVGQPFQTSETHPYRCEECRESFELKSHYVMHELGHEKYKFYSFRSNTVKCICVQCKKPYLYSLKEKAMNSNMCIPCVVKLRERMTVCNIDRVKGNGVKSFLEFSDTNNTPKVKERKQCYSCGRRSDRYFVYGASLLCSLCWQDRTRKTKRNCRSLPRRSHRRYNAASTRHVEKLPFKSQVSNYQGSASTRHVEKLPFKSQVSNYQGEDSEENSNLIGTHFLLSAFDAPGVSRDEEDDDDDDDDQELEDWKATENPGYEDESESNTIVLCDKTGEFIDLSCQM